MSIINLFGDDLFAPPEMTVFYVTGPRHSVPEEYKVLKQFNPREVELSLTHRGKPPHPETMVDFLIAQGFITPMKVN